MASPPSNTASSGGTSTAESPCSCLGGCQYPELPDDHHQHSCNVCGVKTHNMCNQLLRGSLEKADEGIKCGGSTCVASLDAAGKAEALATLPRWKRRDPGAAKDKEDAAGGEKERCAAGENCKQPPAGKDGLTAKCPHGGKMHFRCRDEQCGPGCGDTSGES